MKGNRPRVFVLLTVGSAIFAGFLSLAPLGDGSPRSADASLVLSSNVRDLGRTSKWQEWRVSFPIRNVGTRRLVVHELDLECGCGDRPARVILVSPGKTATLEVVLDTRFVQGPTETAAHFTTNDPSCPRFTLTVRATVDAADPPAPLQADRSSYSRPTRPWAALAESAALHPQPVRSASPE